MIKIISIFIIAIFLILIIFTISLFIFTTPICNKLISGVTGLAVKTEKAQISLRGLTLTLNNITAKKILLSVGQAIISISAHKITAKDIIIKDKEEEELLNLPNVEAGIPGIIAVFKKPALAYLRIENPRVSIRRYRDKTFNFNKLIKGKGKGRPKVPVLPIAKLEIQSGSLVFKDDYTSQRPVIFSIDELNLTAESDKPISRDMVVSLNGSCIFGIEGYSALTFKGAAMPLLERMNMEIKASIRRVELTQYRPYYERILPVYIQRGTADIDANLKIENGIQDSYFVAKTYNLHVAEKQQGMTSNVFGIPIMSFVETLQNENGNIMFDFYVHGGPGDISYKPGSMSKKLFFQAAVDFFKKGLELFKKLKK